MSTATVTKSVRLSPEEVEELARLSEQTAATEASLMKQWIREGMRTKSIELAIKAYLVSNRISRDPSTRIDR